MLRFFPLLHGAFPSWTNAVNCTLVLPGNSNISQYALDLFPTRYDHITWSGACGKPGHERPSAISLFKQDSLRTTMSTREEENSAQRPGKRQKIGSYVLHYVRARAQIIAISADHLQTGPDRSSIDCLPRILVGWCSRTRRVYPARFRVQRNPLR